MKIIKMPIAVLIWVFCCFISFFYTDFICLLIFVVVSIESRFEHKPVWRSKQQK